MSADLTRRRFLGGVAAVAAAGSPPTRAEGGGPLPARPLGRTGAEPSVLAMGCGSRLSMYGSEDQGIEALELALELGITYFDTAQSYGRGNSETWVGKALADRRRDVFLATKIATRDYDDAMRRTEESLRKLQTDQIDLIHIHSLKGADDLAAIEAGALRALWRLRDEKVCRFAGITSHSHPDVLATALERHDFDCTQMALNAAMQGRSENSRDPVDHARKDSFEAVALPVAVRKGMGVLAMKVTGQDALVGSGPGKAGIESLLRYVLTLPVTSAVVGMPTLEQLRENVEAARNAEPLTAAAMRSLSDDLAGKHKLAMDLRFHCHVDA